MVQRAGNKNGVRLRDQNDLAYGVKQTENVPHVLIGGNASGATPIDVNLGMKTVSGTLGALNAELCLENHTIAMGSLVFQVSGTWKGKIVVEGAVDGTYNNLSIVQPGGTIAFTGVNNDNQNGVFRALLISAYTHVRLRMSEYTSGSASVIINAAPLVATPFVWQLTAANLQMTANQATATNLNANVTSNGANLATAAKQLADGHNVKIIGSDNSPLDVYTRTQTPANKVIGVQIGPGDVISNLPVIIDYDHHQVHEGESFRWSVFVSSLASTNSKDIRLVVPNITIPVGATAVQLCPHIRFEAVADSYGQMFLYEGATFSGNGTQRTVLALERNGTYTPKLQVHEDPTVSGTGTMIWQGVTFASKNGAGSIDSSLNEFVLKNNTSYLLRFTSQTTGLKVLLRMVWYEDLGV